MCLGADERTPFRGLARLWSDGTSRRVRSASTGKPASTFRAVLAASGWGGPPARFASAHWLRPRDSSRVWSVRWGPTVTVWSCGSPANVAPPWAKKKKKKTRGVGRLSNCADGRLSAVGRVSHVERARVLSSLALPPLLGWSLRRSVELAWVSAVSRRRASVAFVALLRCCWPGLWSRHPVSSPFTIRWSSYPSGRSCAQQPTPAVE